MLLKTIHPFPARMAPEIALRRLESLSKGAVVLDPMVGSGTTLKIAGMVGCKGLGFDVDPMALLISGVWNTPVDMNEVDSLAGHVLEKVLEMSDAPQLPWIDNEPETAEFVRFCYPISWKQSRDSIVSLRIWTLKNSRKMKWLNLPL
jgi:hypothetical protein